MTTLGSNLPTLADVTRLTGPDGKPLKVGEMLEQSTPVVKDATLIEGNLPTGNRTAVRVSNPVVSLRRLNEGVASTKSTFAARDESCSIIEAWHTMDEKVLQISANPEVTRELYARGDIEAMGQKAEELFWYGNEADDDREFNGVFSRPDYSHVGTQAFTAGGTTNGTLASVVLIGWGPDKVALMYPKGSRAGLYTRDWGLSPVQTSTVFGGTTLAGWRMQYTWDIGLTIIDPRYIVRIAGIVSADTVDPTEPSTQGLTDYTTNIIFLMARAIHRIPNINACKPVFYMPRSVAEGFDMQMLARTSANAFETRQIQGEWLMTFRGIPIRISDQLGYAESRLT